MFPDVDDVGIVEIPEFLGGDDTAGAGKNVVAGVLARSIFSGSPRWCPLPS